MKPRSLSEIARITGGRVVGQDVVVASVSPDSRTVGEGSLFIALKGERADGHGFVDAAIEAGAIAALTEREMPGAPQVVVADVLAALQALAAEERRSSGVTVVAVTGSAGKTLTKDLITGAIGSDRVVHAASGSFNNELGLPLTLLGATLQTDVIVTEMGSRGLGHVEELCAIAAPDIGVVTNVGLAHVGVFGTPDNIAAGKAELVANLAETGAAILNDDDPVVRGFDRHTRARVIRYGLGTKADVRATDVELGIDGRASFLAEAGGQQARVTMALPGEHMVGNALAALAVAHDLGIPLESAASGLEAAVTSGWRMDVTETASGVTVINDAYNANPASMAAALKTARWIARDRRLIAVLGAMRELGDHSFVEHEKVGELAARLGVEELVTVGEEAMPIARAAVREGVEPGQVRSVADVDEAQAELSAMVRPGDVVLLKASRAIGLESLVEVIG